MSCNKCGGYGFIEKYRTLPDGELSSVIDSYPCECRLFQDLDEQAEKSWTGLSRIPVEEGRLLYKEYLKKDVHVTADLKNFALTLRSALWGLSNPLFVVKVVDENMLMSVWLSGIHEDGKKVIDPDFDYSVPARDILGFNRPDLLIVRLGVKSSRNIATPEVLVDVLENRRGAFKPTWVVDSQDKPFRMGHISWSGEGERILNGFEKIDMTVTVPVALPNAPVRANIGLSSVQKKPVPVVSEANKTGTRVTFGLK